MHNALLRVFAALCLVVSLGHAPATADQRPVLPQVHPLMWKLMLDRKRAKAKNDLAPEHKTTLKDLQPALCPVETGRLLALAQQGNLSLPSVAALQSALADAGFDPGPIDGLAGPGTRRASRGYARALISATRDCLTFEEAGMLAKAHAWAMDLDPAMRAQLRAEHGPLGPVRAYYSRNLPAPNISTDPARDQCRAHANADLLGQPLPDDVRGATGVALVRVISVLRTKRLTMDLRPTRINLHLDGFDRVYKMSCG